MPLEILQAAGHGEDLFDSTIISLRSLCYQETVLKYRLTMF